MANPNGAAALAKYRLENAGVAKAAQQNPVQKHAAKPTYSSAVKAMCFSCMGGVGGWRVEVKNCTAYGCPLFPMRVGAKEGDLQKFIDKSSLIAVECTDDEDD